MKRFVVDASVAVKWFVPEIHSGAAERLLDPEISLAAPDLLYPEVGNTVWKKLRRGEITPREVGEIVSAFRSVDLTIHSSADLLQPAFLLAVELDRTVYDCTYLGARRRPRHGVDHGRPAVPRRGGGESSGEPHSMDRGRRIEGDCLPSRGAFRIPDRQAGCALHCGAANANQPGGCD